MTVRRREPITNHRRPLNATRRRSSVSPGRWRREFLAGLNDQPDYSELLAAVTAALTAAAGEGTASALAVSAAAAGYTAFGWAKAARDSRTAPDPGAVQGWASKMIAGAVTDLAEVAGRRGEVAGLSHDAMVKAASGVLRAGRAVTAFANQADVICGQRGDRAPPTRHSAALSYWIF